MPVRNSRGKSSARSVAHGQWSGVFGGILPGGRLTLLFFGGTQAPRKQQKRGRSPADGLPQLTLQTNVLRITGHDSLCE
jgi:hypothetical protein